MHALVKAGADILELGVPFSDPMADGPVIQRASERALKNHISLQDVLGMVREFRLKDDTTPVVLMGYLNPIEVTGYERFASQAAAAGVDGVLTVDLPPEEAVAFTPALRQHNLDAIFLLAPTSNVERIERIAAAASGFIYYVSLRGVTGAAHMDVNEVEAKLKTIRRHTRLPLGVGFGINSPEIAATMARIADAVIVGSAIVKRIEGTGRQSRPHPHRGTGVSRAPARGDGRRDRFGRTSIRRPRMSWFDKLVPPRIKSQAGAKKVTMPEGLWKKCPACGAVLYSAEIENNQNVCPKCTHHMRVGARRNVRLELFLDWNSANPGKDEIGANIAPLDVLKFKDTKKYKDRLSESRVATGETDALVAVAGALKGTPLVACAFEFGFMGGSMGSVVGERFVRAANVCLEREIPLVCFSASGGARMQEALFSLMQMAKTSAVLARLGERRIPYISVLTDPTMGGVSASLAMLGDVIIAEPKALIGFAGPRVIEQTVREKLPEGFQRSEFLLEHGAVDMIVDRRELRDRIAGMLAMLMRQPRPEQHSAPSEQTEAGLYETPPASPA